MKITHIINPVKVPESSDLFVAQPVTFESMSRAKQFAGKEIEVNLVTTQYPEDHVVIPFFFSKTMDLDRSVLDFGNFQKQRKLPLLKDILDRGFSFDPTADYLIYTNVDIAVQPHFYSFINQKIEEGHDSFIINRRTISRHYSIRTLSEAYADYGEPHPGYDCFVFKRELYSNFDLGNICIGAASVGLALYLNLKLYSRSFQEINGLHLSFHIGNDQVWKNKSNSEFEKFNKLEFDLLKNRLGNKNIDVGGILSEAFPTLKKGEGALGKKFFKSFFKNGRSSYE